MRKFVILLIILTYCVSFNFGFGIRLGKLLGLTIKEEPYPEDNSCSDPETEDDSMACEETDDWEEDEDDSMACAETEEEQQEDMGCNVNNEDDYTRNYVECEYGEERCLMTRIQRCRYGKWVDYMDCKFMDPPYSQTCYIKNPAECGGLYTACCNLIAK
ncbi:hypothetical protein ACFL20_00580 [Spirochaetota bacterium]